MRNHIETLNQRVHVVNLDPAAEHFRYPVAADIRDLISLEDVQELGKIASGPMLATLRRPFFSPGAGTL
eukprot:scaffold9209_cov49-Phaeocystis_antarctica.AAC.1